VRSQTNKDIQTDAEWLND